MPEQKVASPQEHYRVRAAEMLALAEKAVTLEARKNYIELAANWEHLAQTLENPHY